MKTTKQDTPDLMEQLKEEAPKSKARSGDEVASEIENEAMRLMRYAMMLRGKEKLQLRVKKEEVGGPTRNH